MGSGMQTLLRKFPPEEMATRGILEVSTDVWGSSAGEDVCLAYPQHRELAFPAKTRSEHLVTSMHSQKHRSPDFLETSDDSSPADFLRTTTEVLWNWRMLDKPRVRICDKLLVY